MKIINRLILGSTIVCFSWIFIFSLFLNSSVFYKENSWISLVISLIVILIWWKCYSLLNNKIKTLSKKTEIIIIILYFIIVTIIQCLVLSQLNVKPGWDFGVVFNNALTYVEKGSRSTAIYKEYFQLFPNNIPIFLLMVCAIKIGKIFAISPILSIHIMNIIFIDSSIILMYLTIRKKMGLKESIFSLFLTFFFLPLFLYTPIVYSDTLSLFVGVLFLYLFTFIKEDKCNKKNIIICILIGITIFLGKSLKITSIIIWLAWMFDYILTHKGVKRFIMAGTMITTFLIINTIFNNVIVNAERFSFKENNYGSYPYTHWIMMGVEDIDANNKGRNTYGGYNANDYDKTIKFSSGKKAQMYNIREYFRRVKKMGPVGYVMFLTKKNVNIWTDGYYFANVALGINPKPKNTTLRTFILKPSTRYYGVYYTQGVQYAFLLITISGAIYMLKEKQIKDIDILRFSILGLLIFLSFWEGRSRYIVNYIPIFITLIVSFYYSAYKHYLEHNTKK